MTFATVSDECRQRFATNFAGSFHRCMRRVSPGPTLLPSTIESARRDQVHCITNQSARLTLSSTHNGNLAVPRLLERMYDSAVLVEMPERHPFVRHRKMTESVNLLPVRPALKRINFQGV